MIREPSKLALGLALIFLGAMMVISVRSQPAQPATSVSFATEPVRYEFVNNDLGDDYEELLPVRIVIPTLSIDLKVEESKIVDGYWEVFEDKAAWGEQSGLPGEAGNQVIFAHAREGLFIELIDIIEGDIVYVMTQDSWYAYRVNEIKEVYPNQVEVVAPTESETLTLYTCSGYQDSKRLIVTAVPVETKGL